MAQSLQQILDERMKAAMKARDSRVLNVLRAIRTKVQTEQTSKNFSGVVDDALHLKLIAAYVKSMSSAIADFQKGGERGADMIEQLRFEIAYLEEFLPKKLNEADTLALVKAALDETGASSMKQLGQVMGTIMKSHRDQVDAGLVRKLIEDALPQ
jgi:hypothetical protein